MNDYNANLRAGYYDDHKRDDYDRNDVKLQAGHDDDDDIIDRNDWLRAGRDDSSDGKYDDDD